MRPPLVLLALVLALAGCGSDGGARSASPASSTTASSTATAVPSVAIQTGPLEMFDVKAACARYCEQLKAAPKAECANPPDAYWQCDSVVEDLRAAISDVQRITPPDVAYGDLEDATTNALEAIRAYDDGACAEQQTGDANTVCGLNLATVRMSAGSVGLTLSLAP